MMPPSLNMEVEAMALRTNTTKAKLTEGKVVLGAIISEHAPGMIELFGALGYDFVMIDCEHGGMDLNQVEHMVRAAEVFNISPLAAFRPSAADHPALPRSGRSGPDCAACQHSRAGRCSRAGRALSAGWQAQHRRRQSARL
jgi:4-hydroxy-2-oxoheptanedioate aldolase